MIILIRYINLRRSAGLPAPPGHLLLRKVQLDRADIMYAVERFIIINQ